jgi:predicted nucleic acid-binding protein
MKLKIFFQREGDVIFVATALSKNVVIWSDDKDFQKQKEIKVFATKDMAERI